MLGSEAQGNQRSVLKIHRRQKVRKKREDKKAGNLGGRRAQHWGGETNNPEEALVPSPALGRKRMRGATAQLLKIAESSGERLKAFTGHVGEERKLSPKRWG